jgi:hypothetical protein
VRFHDLKFLASGFVAILLGAHLVPAATPSPPQKIDLPVPVGEPVQGLKIPQYDEHGKLTMNLTAGSARKIDERQVELTALKIEFTGNEEKQIVVEIPQSTLDLESRILLADSETVIRREDFEIVGQKAEFNTTSRAGQFKGRVHASFRNGAPADTP